MSHFRNKNTYELNMNKYFERSRQARMHPDNFVKLCLSLNMHSARDVIALAKDGFFKNDVRRERLWHYSVMEEMLNVLVESGINFKLAQLHPQVKSMLLQLLNEENALKEISRNE